MFVLTISNPKLGTPSPHYQGGNNSVLRLDNEEMVFQVWDLKLLKQTSDIDFMNVGCLGNYAELTF